ncbi:MAG: hypothetical protein Q7R79_04375 [bacterium]|nr:hypothetical protein [bacterium]
MTKCINCQENFTITPDDLTFYEKMQVPEPRYCPPCRMQRRLVHRNERTLYRRACDLCKKEGVSIYPVNAPFPVYCGSCWWSDQWDPKSFGMAYDPNKSFFEQYKELQNKVPRIALLSITSVNSEYTNNSADNKNCYLIFAAENCEDCMYGRLIQRCKSVVDGCFVYDSELCYECTDCRNCYGCMFSERCQSSKDLLFCFDVRGSQDCILSTNLRNKSYCIENRQYTKEEYLAKKKEILTSSESIEAAKRRFEELKSQTIVKYAFQTKCKDATGDYLYNCHSSRMMFDASNAKDCAYMADAEDPVDCRDGNNAYYKPERCVDIMGMIQSYNSKFCTYIFYCSNVEYCDNLHNCENCFGCIGLRKANHCILNQEYSKEEYEKLRSQLIEDMKKQREYGDFFPHEASPFKYNETLAKDYFQNPQAEEIKTGTYGKENGKDIFACVDCKKNFKITPNEAVFYGRMHLPLPTKDFECRHQDRMRKRTPRKLWKRNCMKCGTDIETTYAPDRPEKVYCEACYQAEVA